MTKLTVLLATLGVATLMFAAPVQAASLTPPQISAIISLLQSFGADSSVIANVSAALGGTTPSSSCVNLSANLTLGSTDAQTGGQVSQLQNYLIGKGYLTGTQATGYYGFLTSAAVGGMQLALGLVSSQSDTAYGIMGPKTRAAINCGAPTPTPTPSTSATIDQGSLTSTSGNPTITGSASGAAYVLMSINPLQGEAVYESNPISIVNGRWSVSVSTYLPPGNYMVNVYDPGGAPALVTGTLTITGSSTQPSATIDQSSLTTGFSYPTITGTATNISEVEIDLKGYSSVTAPVTNGRWSAQLPIPGSGSYAIQVSAPGSGAVLATGTLTITPRISQPSATIDQSSLASSTMAPTVTGTATNTSTVRVLFGDGYYGNKTVPVTNGHWTVTIGPSVPDQTGLLVRVYDSSNDLLTSGTLTIHSTDPVASSATIDQSSLNAAVGTVMLTGTANTSGGWVLIWSSSQGFPGGLGFFPISAGRWSVQVPSLAAGTYQVSVSNTRGTTLTTGTLTVTAP